MLGKLLVQGSTASNQLAMDDPNLRNLAAEVRDSCEHVNVSSSNIQSKISSVGVSVSVGIAFSISKVFCH